MTNVSPSYLTHNHADGCFLESKLVFDAQPGSKYSRSGLNVEGVSACVLAARGSRRALHNAVPELAGACWRGGWLGRNAC
jgi:hypothetical protein